MKKIILFLLTSLFILSGHARESMICGYRDYFHISDSTHPATYIVSASSSPDLYLQVIGPRSFEIRDTKSCSDGYAHVTVAHSVFSWCVLDIKDGPYMTHPSISSSCFGMQFKGFSYDGFNSYSYTLNFD